MKKIFSFFKITISTFTFFLFTINSVSANWIKSESKIIVNSNTEFKRSSEFQDNLSEGVNEDLFNDLRDEFGNLLNDNETGRSNEEPETDALQRKVFTGLQSLSTFGYSVSSAGDVNGDGFDDIIAGARGFNSNTGRAYIYYGGLNMNIVADFILTGEAASDFFGSSVSKAGDLNGDGFDDVIIGAQFNDAGGTNAGRAYIYFGGIVMNNTTDVILTGAAANDNFGFSVSSAGDVNGDGYCDVIIGAIGNDAGGSNAGRAYIFFGGSAVNNISDVILTGAAAGDQFGISVSYAGDVNGDGFEDVITGANFNDANGTSSGRSYIYFGGASMNNTADVIFTGEATGDELGISVSGAGDINGDGFGDVITGAFRNDELGTDAGAMYIFLGGVSMDNNADVIMKGEIAGDFFGYSVSDAGDVNGDGYSDIIAGAYTNDAGGTSAGRAYVFFGGVTMDNSPDVIVQGELSLDFFGLSVSSAGDVNGDGYCDVIAGAYGNDYAGSSAGRVYLYDYLMKNEIMPEVTLKSEAAGNKFGTSVSTAGDVNGDGYDDVVAGARYHGVGGTNTGKIYIYFGGTYMDNIPDVKINGLSVGEEMGCSVSDAGDVNGDGYGDVIAGAQGYSSNTGRSYIFFGGSVMDTVADVIMTGSATGNLAGCSVSSAGDENGDGYYDVVIGSMGYNLNQGRADLYYGGSSMNNVSDRIFTGTFSNNSFGYSVSSAGDMNGDGYSDIIIGAPQYDSNTGYARVYLGNMALSNNIYFGGEASEDNMGISVSDAGDVNGDGFSDVIIGAYGYNSNKGRAYILYGGSIVNNTADIVITGENYEDYLGTSVSSAGDVNGDGYSDVIIGAYGIESSFVYYGSSSMDNYPDFLMKSRSVDNKFGYSVSFAGDLNSDGFSDMIVGEHGISGTDTGAVYIYKGSAISSKPILNYVKDVPDDQGGKVNLKWARSGFDVQGNSLITDYLIQRSFPPSGGNFSWQNISTIPASHESFYTFIDTTPFDSTSNNSGNFFYRITARTSDINQSWKSNILSGRSIDNISPPVVSPFTAITSGVDVLLNWMRSPAPDLLNYILFRSSAPAIDPFTETPLANITDSTFTDFTPPSGEIYYFLVAQDIHGNYSPVAVTEKPGMTLKLIAFIEGFYNSGNNSQISDTVIVELRDPVLPYAIADIGKTIIADDGTAVFKFSNAASGNYYFSVRHRNSIETWNSSPVALSSSVPLNFDLSSNSTQAFGNNQILVDDSPVRFAVYSGDVNQDGTIDLSDGSLIDNDSFNFASGYLSTDVNGDEVIDLADAVFADNNGFNFVGKITP